MQQTNTTLSRRIFQFFLGLLFLGIPLGVNSVLAKPLPGEKLVKTRSSLQQERAFLLAKIKAEQASEADLQRFAELEKELSAPLSLPANGQDASDNSTKNDCEIGRAHV